MDPRDDSGGRALARGQAMGAIVAAEDTRRRVLAALPRPALARITGLPDPDFGGNMLDSPRLRARLYELAASRHRLPDPAADSGAAALLVGALENLDAFRRRAALAAAIGWLGPAFARVALDPFVDAYGEEAVTLALEVAGRAGAGALKGLAPSPPDGEAGGAAVAAWGQAHLSTFQPWLALANTVGAHLPDPALALRLGEAAFASLARDARASGPGGNEDADDAPDESEQEAANIWDEPPGALAGETPGPQE